MSSNNRQLIRQLAGSKRIPNADVAQRLADRARQLDPDGDYQLSQQQLVVNGLLRWVWVVTDVSDGAARREFGGATQPGYRALGRAADYVKD